MTFGTLFDVTLAVTLKRSLVLRSSQEYMRAEKARILPVDRYRFSIHIKSINISPTL